MTKRRWKKIEQLTDTIEAEVLKGLLEAQGFLVHVSRESYQSVYGITSQSSVNIHLLVPDDQAEDAIGILRDFYDGKFINEDE
jgi:uncharacterized protein YpmB